MSVDEYDENTLGTYMNHQRTGKKFDPKVKKYIKKSFCRDEELLSGKTFTFLV